jgi:predicted DNA-binding transcriptional regulator AlpA
MLDETERLVSKAEAKRMTGISYAEMARRIKKGAFPVPIVDGPYRSSRRFFLLSELREYIALKKALRDKGSE